MGRTSTRLRAESAPGLTAVQSAPTLHKHGDTKDVDHEESAAEAADTPQESTSDSSLADSNLGISTATGSDGDDLQRDVIAQRVFSSAPVRIDRFEIEKLVGTGASAAVYAAQDPELNRRVAIKLFGRVRQGREASARDRLLREVRTLAKLRHHNVVAIYDARPWDDRYFIAMELIDGTTLGQWLSARRRSMAEIAAAFQQAGAGLAAAHAAGHVHRDFKPANVLVANDGRVVVSDFGLVNDALQDGDSANLSDFRISYSAVGTPAYVAPEQRAGARAHQSADVYSFAVTLVEAILGKHPAPETSSEWQTELRACVPRRLYRELCSALDLHPARRSQSLAPLLGALTLRRRPRYWAIAGLALVVAGVVIASRLIDLPTQSPAAPSRLRPSALDMIVRSLIQTPPGQRDRRWHEQARNGVMLPIPAAIACDWALPLRVHEFIGDQAVALDARGRVMSCDMNTGVTTMIAEDAACLRAPLDATQIAMQSRDGTVAVYKLDGARWRKVELTTQKRPAGHASRIYQVCQFDILDLELPPTHPALPDPPRGTPAHYLSELRLVTTLDGSVWLQRKDRAPEQLTPAAAAPDFPFLIRAHVDAGLGLIITGMKAQIIDLTTKAVIAEATTPWSSESKPGFGISADGSSVIVTNSRPFTEPGITRVLRWRKGTPGWQTYDVGMSAVNPWLSPSGSRLMHLDGGALRVIDLDTGRRFVLSDGLTTRAQFLDDDRIIAFDNNGRLWQWRLTSLRSWVLADHVVMGDSWMWGFAVCDRGDWIVSAVTQANRAPLMASTRGDAQRSLSKPGDARTYRIACDDDRLLAGTHFGELYEWRLRDGRRVAQYDLGIPNWIWTIAVVYPGGGERVVFVGTGKRSSQIGADIVALRDGKATTLFTSRPVGNTGITAFAVSTDQQRLAAVASSGELVLLDTASGGVLARTLAHFPESRAVRFAQHDQVIVTAGDDSFLRIWSAHDLTQSREINIGHAQIYDLDVQGSLAVVTTEDGHVGAWDLDTGRLVRTYATYSARANVAAFDTSGRWIGSANRNGNVCLHRADSDGCHTVLIGHKTDKDVRHLWFLDNRDLITASDDGTVRQWRLPYDMTTSELACELERRAAGPGVTVSADCATAAIPHAR